MMSNLVGLAESVPRHRRNPLYLETAQIAWHDIAAHRLLPHRDHQLQRAFHRRRSSARRGTGNVGEGCATVTWLQLTRQLLRLTGEARYAEQLEHTVYNALLGAQDPRTGDICYFTPLNGKKPTTPINCCRSSEPRGIALIPQLVWGTLRTNTAPKSLSKSWLQARPSSTASRIASETGYPFQGTAAITLQPAAPRRLTLAVRVPEWAPQMTARLATGETFRAKGGEYLRVRRLWKSGDRVNIAMDLAVRYTPGGKSYPVGSRSSVARSCSPWRSPRTSN